MMRSIRKNGLILIMWLVLPGALYGWTAHVHRQLTVLAAATARSRSDNSIFTNERLLKVLKEGSVAPDFRGRGAIPPSGHGFNPQAPKGRSAGGACHFYRKILNRIHSMNGVDEFWFQAGRCLHLIADLSQPFHTGSGNNEQLFHSLYEKEVENRWAELEALLKRKVAVHGKELTAVCVKMGSWNYLRYKEGGGVYALAVATSRKGRSRYDDLHRLCRLGPWGRELENLTVEALFDGLVGMICFVEYAARLRGGKEKSFNDNGHETFFKRFGFEILILWMHAFTYCRCCCRERLQ